jgi:hypothetical protein
MFKNTVVKLEQGSISNITTKKRNKEIKDAHVDVLKPMFQTNH